MCREASLSFGSKLIVIIILTLRSVCKSNVKEFVCLCGQGIDLFHYGFEASTIRVQLAMFISCSR